MDEHNPHIFLYCIKKFCSSMYFLFLTILESHFVGQYVCFDIWDIWEKLCGTETLHQSHLDQRVVPINCNWLHYIISPFNLMAIALIFVRIVFMNILDLIISNIFFVRLLVAAVIVEVRRRLSYARWNH